MRDELGINGSKKSIHISELEDKLDSLDDPTAWAKAAVLYIAYYLLNPINSNNVNLRYASILGDVNSISQYNWCRHVLDNLREGIRKNNKLNPLGDMHFILINYLERMGKGCRLLSGNNTSPSFREWDELKVTKAMEQVDEIVGFSKAVGVGITKEKKGDDGRVFLPFDPVACPMDKVQEFEELSDEMLLELVELHPTLLGADLKPPLSIPPPCEVVALSDGEEPYKEVWG
ncbi:hypothetical protein LIER_30989 [Lithospermum erythrorhizon]|uniref:Uncharacterized protein n=1 Tax=Lithospermum erythrorhizon TaxID=34254 RepID=A0AAV3RQ59_LITER